MFKSMITAIAFVLATSTASLAQAPMCDTSTIPITSLIKLFKDGDAKANVETRLEVFDQGSTAAILNFVEKKLGRPVDYQEQIVFASREGFPQVLVFFVNKGCAKFSGQLTLKEAEELRGVAKGV